MNFRFAWWFLLASPSLVASSILSWPQLPSTTAKVSTSSTTSWSTGFLDYWDPYLPFTCIQEPEPTFIILPTSSWEMRRNGTKAHFPLWTKPIMTRLEGLLHWGDTHLGFFLFISSQSKHSIAELDLSGIFIKKMNLSKVLGVKVLKNLMQFESAFKIFILFNFKLKQNWQSLFDISNDKIFLISW